MPRRPLHLAALIGLLLAPAACDQVAGANPGPEVREQAPAPVIRVKVAIATVATLDLDGLASGQLHPFRSVTVAAEAAGRVREREIERGDRVALGDLVFRIDASRARLQYRQAAASERASAADRALAEKELDRGDTLAAAEHIPAASHDQLAHAREAAASREEAAKVSRRLARRGVADTRVRAPFEGRVVELHAEVGDYVAPGSPLATVADLSRLRLRAGVTAAEALALSRTLARPVLVGFDDLGGASVPAVLHDISPIADPRSGTYTAEFWLDQPEGEPLRAGMVGRLALGDLSEGERLVIPRAAVTRHRGGFAVWVVVDEGEGAIARRRAVELGRHDAERTEVASGIEPGSVVVVEGMFALADGEPVEIDGARAEP